MNKIEQRHKKQIECHPGCRIVLPPLPDNEHQDFPIYQKDINGNITRTSKNHVLRQTKTGGIQIIAG